MEPETVTEPTSIEQNDHPPESPSLREELESWKQQRRLLQESIAELEKPEPQAALAGNDFTRVLLKRFEQQDSAEERKKSIALAKTLMTELQSKIEAREKYLKQVGDRLRPARDLMQEQARQINLKSQELAEMLSKFLQSGAYIRSDWQVAQPGGEPIEEAAAIVLPHIHQKPSPSTFVIGQLEIISNEQSVSTNPA